MQTSTMTPCALPLLLVLMVAVPAVLTTGAQLGCCMPDAWVGRQLTNTMMVTDVTYATRGMAKVTHDAANQRERYDVKQTDSQGRSATYVFLALYASNVGYKIQGGKCTAVYLGAFSKRCVPGAAHAKILDADVAVGQGDNVLKGTRVTYKFSDLLSTTTGDLMVTHGCIPISETSYKQGWRSYTMISHAFEDVTPGKVSDSVFDIPTACNQVTIQKALKGDLMHLMGI